MLATIVCPVMSGFPPARPSNNGFMRNKPRSGICWDSHVGPPGRTASARFSTGSTRRSDAITSARRDQADAHKPPANWRGRWGVERVFWIRDAVLRDDHSRTRTRGAPFVMSHIRNAFITMSRALRLPNAAETIREHALRVDVLHSRLGILK
jgi:hypothetical protein